MEIHRGHLDFFQQVHANLKESSVETQNDSSVQSERSSTCSLESNDSLVRDLFIQSHINEILPSPQPVVRSRCFTCIDRDRCGFIVIIGVIAGLYFYYLSAGGTLGY